MTPFVLVSTLFLTAVVQAGPAAAQDDPLICGSAQSEWRKLEKANRSILEKFIQKIPNECPVLRKEVQKVLETLPPPPPAGPPTFRNDFFSAELDHCRLVRGGAECTLFVVGRKRVNWIFKNRTYLTDEDGGRNRVVEMTIGNETRATVEGIAPGVYIEPGVRTRIIYRFNGKVDPVRTQAFVLAYPRHSDGWLHKEPAIMRPIPWR